MDKALEIFVNHNRAKLILVSPRSCIAPHKISHPDKLYELANKKEIMSTVKINEDL